MSTESDLARIEAKLTLRAQRLTRSLLQQTYYALVDASPVDTGRFSSNWQLGDGGPNTTTTEDTEVPELQVPEITLGTTYYLTNSLPYASALEHGSSTQAPAGVVAVTVAELQTLGGPIVSAALQDIRSGAVA